MFIDTHCHLDAAEFDADRLQVVQAARAQGVENIIVPAIEVGNFEAVLASCRTCPGCLPALGLHPIYAHRHSEADLDTLRAYLQRERPVAVGEIGLDHFIPDADPARQEFFLIEQLKLARDFDLPVVLHIRRAQDQVLKCLRRIRVRGGIAHAFNGSEVQAREFIKLGFRLGVGGTVTFERARNVRRLAASMPEESLVLETDAPDIPPAFAYGQRNTPEHLPGIAESLAELRGMSRQEIGRLTTRNAREALSLTGQAS